MVKLDRKQLQKFRVWSYDSLTGFFQIFSLAGCAVMAYLAIPHLLRLPDPHAKPITEYGKVFIVSLAVTIVLALALRMGSERVQYYASQAFLVALLVMTACLSFHDLMNGGGVIAFTIGSIAVATLNFDRWYTAAALIITASGLLTLAVYLEGGVLAGNYETEMIPVAFLSCLLAYVLEIQRERRFFAEMAMDQANRELIEALSYKDRFLAHMSHELRTPLNAILGFSEMMMLEETKPKDPAKQQGYIKTINEAGNFLLQMINELLDISKLDAGKVDLHPEPVRVSELVKRAAKQMEGVMMHGGQKLSIEDLSGGMSITTDPRVAHQILLNLLTNAHKYSPDEATVTISAVRKGDGNCMITVSDPGIGMSETELQEALKPFGRIDNAYVKNKEGTGLGLPLVVRLTSILKGEIDFQSAKGVGTKARLTLPPKIKAVANLDRTAAGPEEQQD